MAPAGAGFGQSTAGTNGDHWGLVSCFMQEDWFVPSLESQSGLTTGSETAETDGMP